MNQYQQHHPTVTPQQDTHKQPLSTNKGNHTFRHFKALMRKNAINWRRTWCGSICEIICPALLMLIVLYTRSLIKETSSGNANMYLLQKPIFPVTTFDPTSQSWVVKESGTLGQELQGFFKFTGYINNSSTDTTSQYNPQNDLNSSYNFYPAHCAQQVGANGGRNSGPTYSSPLIGYISTNNQIEKDVVDQLTAIFAYQNQVFQNYKQNSNISYPPQVKQVLNKTNGSLSFGNFTFKKFSSNKDFQDYVGGQDYGLDSQPAVCFAFKITQNVMNSDYELELMFNDLFPTGFVSLPNQKKPAADPGVSVPDIASYNLYVQEGYSFIQNLVVNTILQRATNNFDAQISTMTIPMQSPQQSDDLFPSIMQTVMPLFMILMYVPVMYRMVYRIVYEKVTRAKEAMRMMGLGDFAYWSSWLAYYTILNSAIVLLSWGILQINAFHKQSAFLLFVFMWFYGQSLFGIIMIVQSLFSSPRAAGILTTIVYMGSSLIALLVSDDSTKQAEKIAAYFFFPTVTMTQGWIPFLTFDATVGVTFSTWNLEQQNTSVLICIVMLFVDFFVMLLIGTYLELVLPKTYGEQKHPLFFLGFSWSQHQVTDPQLKLNPISEVDQRNFETKYLKAEYCEAVGREQNQKEEQGQLLIVENLKKVYENGFKAVDGINLKMYADQIFVLLGHNGAGKTSTISILSGLFMQTEGQAKLFGVDMFKNMNLARQIMGVCPQYDVLFELLTTEEHLSFYYDLKGGDPKNKSQEIQQLMVDVGVCDKRSALAYQLSGGNKRKLSVAIALCGGSKFVLLDEPTSGMDLSARRQLWNMLKKYKKDRIILLTTHYMDEADILGDRIAIMAKGKISCLGSSIFLKNKFGVGYNMTLVKSSTDPNMQIVSFLKNQLGEEVKLQSEVQSEMILQIPHKYSDKFASFFKIFDQQLSQLQIRSYGVSMTTLEEVFLKVGHLGDLNKIENTIVDVQHEILKNNDVEIQKENQVSFNMKDNSNELDESFLNNLTAVFYHKFSNYRRNKKAIFNEAILPALIMVFGISVSQIQRNLQSPSRIQDSFRLPLLQQIIYNPEPVIKTDTKQLNFNLINGLPYSKQNFVLNQDNITASSQSLYEFGQTVFNFGTTKCLSPPYLYGSYQIYEADTSSQQYKFVSFVNLTSQDAAGLIPEFMYESILKQATGQPNFQFKLRSSPYPPTNLVKFRLAQSSAATICFIGGIAYAMIITAIASYLVVDRLEGFKHLQVISGMQLKAYWVGNFIFDFIKMYFTIIVTIILFSSYNMNFTGSIIVYLVFPIGILPYTYISSFIFTSDSAAQTFTMFIHFLTLAIGSTIIFALRFAPNLARTGDGLDLILKVIPTYVLGSSVFCDSNIAQLSKSRQIANYSGNGNQLDSNIWARGNIPQDIFALILHFLFWTFLLICIEKGYFSCCRAEPDAEIQQIESSQLDEDVAREAQRVISGSDSDVISVKKFKKVFDQQASLFCWDFETLVAVSDLSFGLQTGECFALLGVNGAGKSTTFKSLTHEVLPTNGQIKIANYDLSENFEKARKLIGYCPQANLVFDTMTVEEHIYYYAMIKGIPGGKRKILVEQAIASLGLQDHRIKPAGTLSGGNKRKLCVAQALVGNPPIILLDEPSAGMDPEARRFMWDVVASIAKKKTSAVVLTTHSMDEAEALSTKMGIMVKGGIFKCFGSSQHIKNKFGTGYVLEIKVKTIDDSELPNFVQYLGANGEPNLENLNFDEEIKYQINTFAFTMNLTKNEQIRLIHGEVNLHLSILALAEMFRQVELLEKFGNYMKVRVPRLDQSIGTVFGILEQLKATCDVSEYSVGQTTLEQIFQAFADQSFTENVKKFQSVQNGRQRMLRIIN